MIIEINMVSDPPMPNIKSTLYHKTSTRISAALNVAKQATTLIMFGGIITTVANAIIFQVGFKLYYLPIITLCPR